MNISHKHKLIWLAPEKCATKIVKQILSEYDFIEQPTNNNFRKSDYDLISSIRNPYDRIFSIFINFELRSVFLNKTLKNEIKKHFNLWIQKLILNEKLFTGYNFSLKINISDLYFHKDIFKERTPDFLIRMESIQEDLEKLDFIKNDPNWNSEKIKETLLTNKFKVNREYTFNSMYDIENAKKVYFFYKNHFHLAGYDPFSFTTENLTDNDKISFLHDIL